MTLRKTPLITGEHYHVVSRSSFGFPIFSSQRDASIMYDCLLYYARNKSKPKFSYYVHNKSKVTLDYSKRLVTIEAFCIMPTHFHILLKQEIDSGIANYMQKVQTSFAHYFNKKHHQIGSLFAGRFQAILIDSEEQFMHVSRYIHLNPSSAGIIDDPSLYPYSSFPIYLNDNPKLPIDTIPVLSCFNSLESYKTFVLSRKDYQRKLQLMKQQLLDYDEPGSSLEITEPGSDIL